MCPIVHQLVHGGVFFLAGQGQGEQRSDDGLVVRPPEFHIVPILLHRLVVHISKIKQPTVLAVPAPCHHPVQNLATGTDQVWIVAAELGLPQDKPGALDRMAGVECATVKVIDDRAVRRDHLHHALDLRLHEVSADLLDGVVDVPGERVVAKIQPQLLRGNHLDHRLADGLGRSGVGELRLGQARLREVPLGQAEQFASRLRVGLLAGRPGHGRVSDCAEALGEHITPLADRPTVAGEVKPHTTIGISPVFPDEIEPATGPVQPGAILLHGVEQRREQPGTSALLPHALVIVE